MKKTTTLICIMLAILEIQAQDYLITFAGAGDTSVVSTIIVNNLTSGATVTLNGGDILHLSSTLGIENLDFDNKTLQISPNPMSDQSMLTFAASESGNTVISIVDLSGRFVCKINANLTIGTHTFRISGISQGLYFVNVTGKANNYTTKLVSQGNLHGEESIEYISSVMPSTSNPLKTTSATIDMLYNSGDQLLYKGISGIYSTIVTDVPTSSKTTIFNFAGCTDYDNNNYPTVQIGMGRSGTQTWMAENLRTTYYRNGDAIPNVTDNTTWIGLNTGAYCWYDNDGDSYKMQYGALYNWFTVSDNRNLCPAGWHVPTDSEWIELMTFLGGDTVAGGKLKETGTAHWRAPNTGATNESGFTGIAAGMRYIDGTFNNDINLNGYFWTSTETASVDAQCYVLNSNQNAIFFFPTKKIRGQTVRCIKD